MAARLELGTKSIERCCEMSSYLFNGWRLPHSLLFHALVIAMVSQNSAASELSLGAQLPALQGQYLSGRKATLPIDASGRVALLLFGFSYQSRFPVEEWERHFRADYGSNPQVTFYEIPMIGGMARMGKWFIDSGLRRGTPQADYEHVITVYGGTDSWKARFGVLDQDTAYLVLLDQKGNVAWLYSGPFDEAAYKGLAEQLRKLLP